MKKVLLLGDSIRLSYQDKVRDLLSAEAEVTGPQDNCRFAKYTLWYVNEWIGAFGAPDIIHWNNGLWDVYHFNAEMGIFTAKDDYVRDLSRVLQELRKTNAEIIWATTTPVDAASATCRNDEIDTYNGAAVEFMQAEGIPVNDMNAVVRQNCDGFISSDHMHMTEAGQTACAEAVAAAVRRYL